MFIEEIWLTVLMCLFECFQVLCMAVVVQILVGEIICAKVHHVPDSRDIR